jgi:very-short-patch-repair endonuclease
MPNKGANSGREAAIARIAARQHGVVTRTQLLAAGLLPSGISDRVSAGRLHRIHRGVYAVGHPNIGNEGRWMAAVLTCGKGAVLSHRGAGALWGILRPRPEHDGESLGPVDVTVPGDGGRKRRGGIRLHRSTTLFPADVTRRAGIPVTKPARTLRDLRRTLPSRQFAAALRQAEFLRLPLEHRVTPDRTRSELETRLLAICRRHRLPRPEVNVPVDRFLVDFLWRPARLIVELDGWEFHRTRSAFEEDRARDARLKLLGYDVLRFTWRQVQSEPRQVAAAIRALLRR